MGVQPWNSAPGAPVPGRPLGAAILAVLIGIFGVIALLVAVFVLVFSTAGVAQGFAVFGVGVVGGILLLIFSIVLLLVARGLWDLRLWALVLCIIVVGLLWISDLLRGELLTLGSLILLVLLIYLIAVHRHFT